MRLPSLALFQLLCPALHAAEWQYFTTDPVMQSFLIRQP